MGDCSDIYGCRKDGGDGPSRQTTVRQIYSKNFAEKSLLFKSRVQTVRHFRLDGRTSAASNFHIRLLRVRTMGDERPNG
jgi:hypothetical protein